MGVPPVHLSERQQAGRPYHEKLAHFDKPTAQRSGASDGSIRAADSCAPVGPARESTPSAENIRGSAALRPRLDGRGTDPRGTGARLRIGYVSGDFREHTVPRFIGAALKHHDRSAVELFCYSDVRRDDADAVTAALKAMVENWRDTAGVPDQRLAERVREDGIDILVDLRGHGAGNRLLLFAGRAAPVQVNMVGYFDTTGLAAMDWRVTDGRQDPPGASERFHTERLARLPGGCWCYAPDEEIGGPPSPPVQGPPAPRNGFLTFGSLNKIVKVSRPCAQLWALVLGAVPNSWLLLPVPAGAVAGVRERLVAVGVPADRLIIAGKTGSRLDYLRRFNEIDICLDPFPFNGITTTCDSLWMGVPVASLAGATSLSGVTYSTTSFALSGATASTKSAANNFNETTYGYGPDGTLTRTADPNGTITDAFVDGMGRPTATYVGTDDSTSDGNPWTPGVNNSSTNNMLLV